MSSFLPMNSMLMWECQAFRQDRPDVAEHMFAKCKQLDYTPAPREAEDTADLLYEIGKQALIKRDYEVSVKWLERACNMLGEQDLGMLSSEAGELRLCMMQALGESCNAWGVRKTKQSCSSGADEAGDDRSNRQSMAFGETHGG